MKASQFSDAQKAFILKQGADEPPVMVTNAAMKLLNNSMVDEVAFQTPNRRSRRW